MPICLVMMMIEGETMQEIEVNGITINVKKIEQGLKKCPFCGGRAEIEVDYSERYSRWYWRAVCTVCHSQSATRRNDANTLEAIKDTAARWNRREPAP